MTTEILKRVNVFNSNGHSGAPQYLHFYPELDQLERAFSEFAVQDEFDHSFFTLLSETNVYIRWKNKQGEISFCGSGAYGVGIYLYNQEKIKLKKVSTFKPIEKLSYTWIDNKLWLNFKGSAPRAFSSIDDVNILYATNIGVYLVEVDSQAKLQESGWIQNVIENYSFNEIHGLCFFYWDKNKNQGFLRYFVPWHGRDEDYVTGSIHQFLTPLVADKYDIKKQSWHQLSQSSGELSTCWRDSVVSISALE